MRITDIIRGILDQVDATVDQKTQEPEVRAVGITPGGIETAEPCSCQDEEPNLVAIIQQLAGVPSNTTGYQNEPQEIVAPIGAAFPKGDDMHHSKNPADIRSNSISMYPAYQAEKR